MAGNGEILRDLPPTARRKMVAALAGRQVRIPLRPEILRKRIPDLSQEEAAAVVSIAGNAVVYVPRRDVIRAKHSVVRSLAANGVSTPAIAAEVGFTESRVRQILKEFSK